MLLDFSASDIALVRGKMVHNIIKFVCALTNLHDCNITKFLNNNNVSIHPQGLLTNLLM